MSPNNNLPTIYLTKEEILNSAEYKYLCQPIIRECTNTEDDEEYLKLYLDLESWEAPQHVQDIFTYRFGGYDTLNRPIWMVKLSSKPLKDVLDRGDGDLIERYLWQFAHWGAKSVYAKPPEENPSSRVVIIVDASDLTNSVYSFMNRTTIKFLIRMILKYRGVSNKVLGLGVGININKVGTIVVNLLKPLARKNLKKIEFYSFDDLTWQPRLVEIFGKKDIPSFEGSDRGFYRVALKS